MGIEAAHPRDTGGDGAVHAHAAAPLPRPGPSRPSIETAVATMPTPTSTARLWFGSGLRQVGRRRTGPNRGPVLLVDIGATMTRIAWMLAPGRWIDQHLLHNADFGSPIELLTRAVGCARFTPAEARIVTPADDVDECVIGSGASHPGWRSPLRQCRRWLGLERVVLMSPGAALAAGATQLDARQLRPLVATRGQAGGTRLLIGLGGHPGIGWYAPGTAGWRIMSPPLAMRRPRAELTRALLAGVMRTPAADPAGIGADDEWLIADSLALLARAERGDAEAIGVLTTWLARLADITCDAVYASRAGGVVFCGLLAARLERWLRQPAFATAVAMRSAAAPLPLALADEADLVMLGLTGSIDSEAGGVGRSASR